jgi:hypothetical protein
LLEPGDEMITRESTGLRKGARVVWPGVPRINFGQRTFDFVAEPLKPGRTRRSPGLLDGFMPSPPVDRTAKRTPLRTSILQ